MKTLLPPAFLLVAFSLAAAQTNEPAPVPLTDAEQRELQVVERFWTLLERTPRRGTSFDRVYGYYVDTGRLEELMKRCRDLTEANPDNAKSWLLLGLVLSRRSDDAATVAALEKAMTLDETDLLAPFYLGETYIAQGRLRDAAEALEASLARALASLQQATTDRATLSRDVLAILQTLGRVYERFSDRENSNRIWDKLEELFPGDRDILVRIAETLEEEGQFDEAFKRYRRLAEIPGINNFDRVQYTLAAADIKVRLGDKQGAIEDFETLLEELAGDSWLSRSIRDRVERIFVRQADFAGLAGYYQKRLQTHPNDLDTVRRYAITLVRLARPDEAKELLANTLERAPSHVQLRLALIDLLVADKDFEAVDRHYAKIDEIEPNNPDHISQWGLAVLENTSLGEPARRAAAVRIWNRMLTARPDDTAILIMVAELANGAKIHEEAERLYKRAVELRPNDPGFKEYLGFFYHNRDRREEAVATLWQIVDGNRRTATNLSQLGGIFRSLGYAVEAMTAMNEAVTLDEENFELRMQYADLLFTNDRTDDAETQYLEAEKLARPLTDEFARFLHAYTRLLQSSLKLNATAETLAQRLNTDNANATASDYWRLATYQSALGLMGAATESIETAMELAPNMNILLDAAASIFEKGHDQVRAAAIYEKLAASDPPRRVEHLKRLANLRRDLGEMNQAIETARLVMATGAGNAANSRFYADMLLSIGRRADGIEILRRAVRLDPTDTTSLATLSDVLFDANDIDEALEIQWRIFDRTEDLQGKLGAVTRMSTFYQQAQRFGQLIERLRLTANDSASRREAAYCLAQAYVSVSDFEMARQTLETLLIGGDTEDTLLLSQLAKISELQGDLSTAIRYQEMLCDRLQGGLQVGQESARLLTFYQQAGEREKAVEHLLRFFIESGNLHEQVQAIDDLLSREDYESAQRVLDRIEGRNPRNWELLYRRLMLEFWQDDMEAASGTARRILALDTARDELSAKRQHAAQATQQRTTSTTQTPQQQQTQMARMMGQGYQPWGFGNHQGYNQRIYYSGGVTVTHQQAWQMAHSQIMPVLFRDRLRLEQYFYQRSSSLSTAEPPKPQWEPETFADARLAAAAWLMRIAIQEDINAFREENPTEEGEQEKAATAQNGLTLDRFTEAVDAWRESAPASAADVARIEERLRLEYFLQIWFQTVQQAASSFPEGEWAKLLFTLKDVEGAKDPTAMTGPSVVPPMPYGGMISPPPMQQLQAGDNVTQDL
ncbi:MAG: tetratricopeptide repeat protein, partial [Planctomycetaceae bacterium]|nr:tetratricopeptide repeat protein [Planctomycetaceae bacterium]